MTLSFDLSTSNLLNQLIVTHAGDLSIIFLTFPQLFVSELDTSRKNIHIQTDEEIDGHDVGRDAKRNMASYREGRIITSI